MISVIAALYLAATTLASVPTPPAQPIQLGEPAEYEVAIYEVTAYTAGPESTGKTPDHPAYGITASGAEVQRKHTLACPPGLPFGTRAYIAEMERTYTCQDRGAAITNGRLDVYMRDVDDALAFGRRELTVLILPPLSGEESVE